MNYRFIGWCNNDGHDKVWAAIDIDDRHTYPQRVLTVWGRRGAKLQTKMTVSHRGLTELIHSKWNKGYSAVDPAKLNQVYPDFQNDLEKTAIWATLKF